MIREIDCKWIVGIDVGVTGAIAFINQHDPSDYIVLDIPAELKVTNGKKRRSVDFASLVTLLEEYLPEIATCFVEAVHPMHTNGSIASFKLGQSYGGVVGVLTALKLPVSLVTPQVWKKHHNLLKKDKSIALAYARSFYGTSRLNRAKDHNRAEALLIARYGYDMAKPF